MGNIYRNLGQLAPGTVLTDGYTVGTNISTVISSIVVCNQAGGAGTYRISHAIAGAGDTSAQYLAYDVAIAANSSAVLKLGLTMGSTDVIRVRGSASTISFNI